jgi:hypothetical protein
MDDDTLGFNQRSNETPRESVEEIKTKYFDDNAFNIGEDLE